MIKKVLFIGDHYRGDQDSNIKKLYILLSPLLMDLNIKSSIIDNIDYNNLTDRWLDTLNKKGESLLSNYDLVDTLVIGFEINPLDKLYLNNNNISWIDIEIDPIRFLDDLYFKVSSSIDFDFSSLALSKNQIKFYANLLKHKHRSSFNDIKPNSLLIIGQTPIDKSLYYDNKFKSLLDYLEQLDLLTKKYNYIYYRPHPYLSDEKVDKEIISRYNATLLAEKSYYELISCNNLTAVCGISSSSLYEAKYFDKDVFFLENKVSHFSLPISMNSLMKNEKFWSSILDIDEKSLHNKLDLNIPQNSCRDLYSYWSYETDTIRLEKKYKTFHSKTINLENKIDKISDNIEDIINKMQNLEKKSIETQKKLIESKKKEMQILNYYNDMVNSASWRLTKPFRVIGIWIRTFIKELSKLFQVKNIQSKDSKLYRVKKDVEDRKNRYKRINNA
jgi:hypothetical protein